MSKQNNKSLREQRGRLFLSGYHLRGAGRMAQQARMAEVHIASHEFDDEGHSSSVISAIWFSVAFLETAINELFETSFDSKDTFSFFPSTLDAPVFSASWKQGEAERLSILGKYRLALALGGKPPFNEGTKIVDNAKALIDFRNGLMHFKSELSTWEDSHTSNKLPKRLSGKFTPAKLHSGQMRWKFPLSHLSADCAFWAVESAVNFADSFFVAIEYEAPSTPSLLYAKTLVAQRRSS